MEEVTLPCFLISLPKAIFVIARLVGPFSEKKLPPRSWKCCPRPAASGSIFNPDFTVFRLRTDLEPFLSALNWLTSGFVYATLSFTTVFVDTRLWNTKHPRKRFQNFRQFCVLSTGRIEIHQSQPASMT